MLSKILFMLFCFFLALTIYGAVRNVIYSVRRRRKEKLMKNSSTPDVVEAS